jgi:hypothetical protein
MSFAFTLTLDSHLCVAAWAVAVAAAIVLETSSSAMRYGSTMGWAARQQRGAHGGRTALALAQPGLPRPCVVRLQWLKLKSNR